MVIREAVPGTQSVLILKDFANINVFNHLCIVCGISCLGRGFDKCAPYTSQDCGGALEHFDWTVTKLKAYMSTGFKVRLERPYKATLVSGTHLWFMRRVNRLSESDRNGRGRYWCESCKAIKIIRIADVRPGTTISCGCIGRQLFIEYHEKLAGRLPDKVRNRVWSFRYAKPHWTRRHMPRPDSAAIAKRVKLYKYLVDFVISTTCKSLRAVAVSGKSTLDVDLPHSQWTWLYKFKRSLSDHPACPATAVFMRLLQATIDDDAIPFTIGECE
jgi:hypothetical protein